MSDSCNSCFTTSESEDPNKKRKETPPPPPAPKKRKQGQTDQDVLDEFWSKFESGSPGKGTIVSHIT